MRHIAILSLVALLVGMAGCLSSPKAVPTKDPGQILGPSPVPGDMATIILQTPVASRLVGPGPTILAMEEAQEALPFPVETPEYLPKGFIAEGLVAVMLQPPLGGQPSPDTEWRPVGVRFRYVPVSPVPGDRQRFVMVEQSLLSGNPQSVSGERKVVPIGRHFADVWQSKNLQGQTFTLIAWDEIGYGTSTLVTSTEDEEETIEVAWSFQ